MISPPRPLSREELVAKLARHWRIQPGPAAERIDAVLDEVLGVARPRLESSWEGSDVLQQLLRWKGERR